MSFLRTSLTITRKEPASPYIHRLALVTFLPTSRFEHALRRWRIFDQLVRRTPRAAEEFAAAVGAVAAEGLSAGGAEGAFKGADERRGRVGREIDVAALAVGSEL